MIDLLLHGIRRIWRAMEKALHPLLSASVSLTRLGIRARLRTMAARHRHALRQLADAVVNEGRQ
ncbi:hypothetical protein [Sphingomonas oryzagri]|uniref:Transposase DDE domain-containing protein n=1 Tax=Sphingomonas oryzagri TaxID=3042314 RepID=A0ABT6N022_9SPHN|nr:hypothetical protein [Sphingomonas oryzagri]MDH7638103.1 hypothetical protein [Sphingomonas oryzagri]